ncbi:MAG: phosphoheptose isomerase [Bacteroidetes bacterium HGW-Bacteroidetes-17]|jgi:D-sedoheptulose 7-phosphate isomerase|nr:MAG: phosphoheptose isomerase [Bacteroidetes bacterium HGW-Bacteroidetes-17]
MKIKEAILDSIFIKKTLLESPELLKNIQISADLCVNSLRVGGKILFCGNGGSAADAQHLAAELSGRFYYDREPLDAEALHVNTSYLTAVANDYSYDEIYARLTKAKGKPNDILIGISTSGNSENIIRAMQMAKSIGMKTIGWTGESGGKLKTVSDCLINIPSTDTPRIQEAHILVGHMICEIIESEMFPR